MAVRDTLKAMLPKSAVNAARAELERLQQAEAKWADARAAKTAELDQLEQHAGSDLLAADLAGESSQASTLAGRIAALRAEIELAGRTAEAARLRRLAALRALWQAEAAALRQQTAELRQQADQHEEQTTALLAQLKEHEGVTYVVEPPRRPDGSPHGGVLQGGGAPVIVYVQVPHSQRLRNQALALEAQAAELERREPPAS